MISFQNVSKKYGQTSVLEELNLEIKAGDFVSIIGRSGAGKSTLVYILMGAEAIDKGSVMVDGHEIRNMSFRELQYFRRKIGVVFQDYKLLPQKTVAENVSFAMEVCGYDSRSIKKRTAEVLEIVNLSSHSRKFPNQLSGGERQRVAIARALVHNPAILIADEPTGNLDPRSAKEIIDLLKNLNQKGMTILLTTHNVTLVNYLKKRVVMIEDGKVMSDKEKSAYHQPVELQIT